MCKKILFILLLVIDTFASLDLTQEELDYIAQNPTVTYSETNWKPLSIIENSKMSGIMGDYLDLISTSTGLNFKFVASNTWPEVLKKFRDHKIDMIPGIGEVDNEHAPGILSSPYAEYNMVIVTRDEYMFIDNINMLKTKKIAVPKFFTSYNHLKKKYPKLDIIETKSIEEALLLVSMKKADAFIGHIAPSLFYISKLNLSDLKVSGITKYLYKHHILLHENQEILHSIINKALASITTQQKSVIYSTWVQVKVEQKIPLILFIEIVAVLLILLLVLYRRQKVLNKYNKELETLTHRMNLSLDSIKGGIWDLNIIDGNVFFDLKVKRLLGYGEDGFPNKFEEWQNRVHPDDLEQALVAFDSAVKNRDEYLENIHRLRHKDGHYIWISDMAKLVFDENRNPVRMIGIISDITEKKEALDEIDRQKNILYHQANYDSLTDLPNRVLFMDRLFQSLTRAHRYDAQLALLFIDLDEFKQINDSLGHDTGDQVLKEVTKRLLSITRKGDTLARLGGDEFTIVMEDLENSQSASLLAQKILDVLKTPFIIENNTLYISTSIGISLYPNDGIVAEQLLKFADTAMYKAKNAGRNNFKYYTKEMTEIALKRVVMEVSLRDAIKNEEFIVYYQPQMNGVKNSLIGVEALIRWEHPTEGMIYPDAFIPIAEQNGLIVEIDRLVMKKAMRQVVKWYDSGLNPGILALNLSLKQLNSADFISFVQKCMKEFSFKAEWLEFEIVERELMINPQSSIRALQYLSDMGIELAIDDFGTGYSSLSYLKKLPIDKLKIDKSFVDNIPNDEEDVGISRAIIALSKSLNLSVIAEGVETSEQKEFLVNAGCQNIQGYFYSKPLSCEDIKLFIQEKQN